MDNDQAFEHVSNALSEAAPEDFVLLARWEKTTSDDKDGVSDVYCKRREEEEAE